MKQVKEIPQLFISDLSKLRNRNAILSLTQKAILGHLFKQGRSQRQRE